MLNDLFHGYQVRDSIISYSDVKLYNGAPNENFYSISKPYFNQLRIVSLYLNNLTVRIKLRICFKI